MATATEQVPAPAGEQVQGKEAQPEPAAVKAEAPAADGTTYVVLCRGAGDEPWTPLDRVTAQGQESAKRKAAEASSVVQAVLQKGEAVQLVAVPSRSFTVTTVQLEQPKPRLKLT